MSELPRYQCHKIVRAAKVVSAEHLSNNEFYLTLELPGGEAAHAHWRSGKPTNAGQLVGGYIVQYDDAYESWSPAAAFESGYTLIVEPGTRTKKAMEAVAARKPRAVKS